MIRHLLDSQAAEKGKNLATKSLQSDSPSLSPYLEALTKSPILKEIPNHQPLLSLLVNNLPLSSICRVAFLPYLI